MFDVQRLDACTSGNKDQQKYQAGQDRRQQHCKTVTGVHCSAVDAYSTDAPRESKAVDAKKLAVWHTGLPEAAAPAGPDSLPDSTGTISKAPDSTDLDITDASAKAAAEHTAVLSSFRREYSLPLMAGRPR